MKIKSIDELPELVKLQKITEKEAGDLVWVEIYTKPQNYYLQDMDPDQKSEFLIEFRKKIPGLFNSFYSKNITFTNFIKSCIFYYKKSWKRKEFNNLLESSSLSSFMESQAASDTEKYNLEEMVTNIENENHNYSEMTRIQILTVLVLTLKSCRDVTDETLQKVSKISGITEEKLHTMVMKLKESMKKNDAVREKLIAKRDNSYFFHRKYMLALNKLSPDSSSYSNLKEKYETQTKKWQKRNRILNSRYRNSPSNSEIANLLGLRPRTVCFYINKAKSNQKNIEKNSDSEKETKILKEIED